MNPSPVMKRIEEIAILTGSAIIPGYVPHDLDYFAPYSEEHIAELKRLGAWVGHDATESFSSDEWGDYNTLYYKDGGRRVEIFFVKGKYFEALALYTDLLRELCKDEFMRGVLSIKPMRVLLARTCRFLIVGGEELAATEKDSCSRMGL